MIDSENYEMVAQPSITKPFQLMNNEEAQLFFDWHMNTLSSRIHNMCILVNFRADYTPASLTVLWSVIIEYAKSKAAKATHKDNCDEYNSILNCTGLYTAEVLRRNNNGIYWACNTGAEDDDMSRNKPVLVGFCDRNFQPPYPMAFEPVHMVGVQASRIERGCADKKDLLSLYNRWCMLL